MNKPMRWYYDNCEEFKEYVDKVANSRKLSQEEIMRFIVTKEYLKMLIAEGRAK